ncbi:MAG: hypothetical protein AAF492_30965 [Verrucomicrobiota bacterium]
MPTYFAAISRWVLLLLFSGTSAAQEIVLYDAGLGTPPANQGWTWLSNPLFGNQVSQSMEADAVRLDTSQQTSDQSGYFIPGHPMAPTLDCDRGFTVSWNVRILSENHITSHRAGFSVIVVCSDLRALEVGIWTNEVWAQADMPLFTHAEGANLNTTDRTNRYDLLVHGSNYSLRVNGTNRLNGPLRDYSAFSGFPDPYETPDFIFLGDDTSSADADVHLSRVSVVPWPSSPTLTLSSRFDESLEFEASGLSSGYRYHLERSPLLQTPDWTQIQTLDATGNVATVTLPTPSDRPRAYYRLIYRP